MRKVLSLTVLCIMLIATGFILAGCVSTEKGQAFDKRLGAVEQVIQTKADKAEVKAEADKVNARIGDVEAKTAKALTDAAVELAKLSATKADKAEVNRRFVALYAAKADTERKLATVAVETAAHQASIIKIEDQVKKQAADNGKLTAMLRAHRRGDKLALTATRVALGDKAPTGAVQCWGFVSGRADLEDLLKRSPGCKKQLDELKEQIAADKVEILGAVGFEDRVKCREPVTDECKNVAQLRGTAVAKYLGVAEKFVSTEPPTDDVGASPAENRGVVVFVKKK